MTQSRHNLPVLLRAASALGPGWALTRARLLLARRLGHLERCAPARSWSEFSLAQMLSPGIPTEPLAYCEWRRRQAPRFLFESLPAADVIGEGSVAAAERVLDGEFPFFGGWRRLGYPPRWREQISSSAETRDCHWSRIDEFGSGDIKLAWETSRFGWAFTLARAFARTGDDRFAESFWKLLESWIEQNPPNRGVQWKCGQETALRSLALCFAVYALADSAASTPSRVAALVSTLAVHARRIVAHIGYAISQKNNHALSEAAGLWTIGLLFPELKEAERWRERGRDVLEAEVRRQIYADGAYIQHSANYHRLMLHLLAWCIRLGEENGRPLSPELRESFGRATRFLVSITDLESGRAPNYGPNDGALLLPLSDCEYPDMRPVLQSCYSIAENRRLFPRGAWDEELVWLSGAPSLAAATEAAPRQHNLDGPEGGCFTLHSCHSWAMLRASRYRDRPSHADQLHLDLWWRGRNVFCDPGTYSYNAAPPFDHAFASTRFHNTVTVDGADQMTRLSRFLWVDWAAAGVLRYRLGNVGAEALEATHNGYRRHGVLHRRAVSTVGDDVWIVVDDVIGRGEHNLKLHWLMADLPLAGIEDGASELRFTVGEIRLGFSCSNSMRFDIIRGGSRVCGSLEGASDESRGWTSTRYARLDPALSLAVDTGGALPVRFITVLSPAAGPEIQVSPVLDHIETLSRTLSLGPIGSSPLFSAARS
jgi:Heparinase II/III-like protein/Heparinase II/III N-terminus